MNQEQRVIFDTTDISALMGDFRGGIADFAYTAGKYLYIGSIFPFNNLWFEMDTVNDEDVSVSIDVWYDGRWTEAVDIADGTTGLKTSGRLQWNTNIDKSWSREQKSSRVTGLETFEIYDRYWIRLSWDDDMAMETAILYIGQKFSSDGVLKSFYPDLLLANMLDSFETDKENWNEQHFMAAEHIVRDLKKRNIIKSRSQLLDNSLFTDASCHKVAEIVYTAFGAPYLEQKIAAAKAYEAALNVDFFSVDKDADGRLDLDERFISTKFGTR